MSDETIDLSSRGVFNPTPEQKARRRKILKWVGIILGGVGIVVGIIVGISSCGKKANAALGPEPTLIRCADDCAKNDTACIGLYRYTKNGEATYSFICSKKGEDVLSPAPDFK